MTNREKMEQIFHEKIEKDKDGLYPCPPFMKLCNPSEDGEDCYKCQEWWDKEYPGKEYQSSELL